MTFDGLDSSYILPNVRLSPLRNLRYTSSYSSFACPVSRSSQLCSRAGRTTLLEAQLHSVYALFTTYTYTL